jgi:MFS family permease
MNRYQKVLLLSSYIWFFGEGLLGPLYAVFTQRIGGDILELTGAYAFYLIMMGALAIFVGKFSDHHSKKYLITVGYGLNAVVTFGYLFVDSPFRLFFVQGLLGVAAALATPTWNSLFSIYEDRKHVGEEWGLDSGGSQIITGLAVITGGFIITYSSFTALFVLMGIIQVMATLVLARMFSFGKK